MIHRISERPRLGAAVAELTLLSSELREADSELDSVRRLASMGTTRASVGIEGFAASLGDTVRVLEDDAPVTGLAEGTRRALQNYGRAMARVAALAVAPSLRWTLETLTDLHFHATLGEPGAGPGVVRTEAVHVRGAPPYEPPVPAELPGLLAEVLTVLNDGGDPLITAIGAHLHLAAIHPFADGNGRVARLVHCLVVARAFGLPAGFASVEEALAAGGEAYLAALRSTNGHHRLGGADFYEPSAGTEEWSDHLLAEHVRRARALRAAIAVAPSRREFCRAAVRRRGMPERLARYLVYALVGLPTTNDACRRRLGVPGPTVTLDLRRLVDAGVLVRRGAGPATDYVASPMLRSAWGRVGVMPADASLGGAVEEVRARDAAAVDELAREASSGVRRGARGPNGSGSRGGAR